MNNYRKNLTNRFAGQINGVDVKFSNPSVSEGVANHMTIIVKNNDESNPLPFAIIPANFDTLRIKTTLTKSAGDSGAITGVVVTKEYNNCEDMQAAGFNIKGVANDGNYSDETGVDYNCSSADPSRTIKQFLNYIKLNPTRIQSLEVVSSDANAFDTNMSLCYINPFFKNAEQEIDLSVFYSLFQQATDRIRMDFDGKVELSDLSFLRAVIPADTTMKFIFRFV